MFFPWVTIIFINFMFLMSYILSFSSLNLFPYFFVCGVLFHDFSIHSPLCVLTSLTEFTTVFFYIYYNIYCTTGTWAGLAQGLHPCNPQLCLPAPSAGASGASPGFGVPGDIKWRFSFFAFLPLYVCHFLVLSRFFFFGINSLFRGHPVCIGLFFV